MNPTRAKNEVADAGLLTAEQVAAHFLVKQGTFLAWARSGFLRNRIPPEFVSRVGRSTFYKSDIVRFIESEIDRIRRSKQRNP